MIAGCYGRGCPVSDICRRYELRSGKEWKPYDIERNRDDFCSYWVPTEVRAGESADHRYSPPDHSGHSDRSQVMRMKSLMEVAVWCLRSIADELEETS